MFSADTELVFAAYLAHKSRRCVLDTKRRRLIAARLGDGWSAEELIHAIDGCFGSAWHQGRNNRGRKYDSLELILRNSDKVEAFIELADREPVSYDRAAELMKEAQDEARASETDPRGRDGCLPAPRLARLNRGVVGEPVGNRADAC